MANETMLYKWPGPYQLHGGNYDYIIVDADMPGYLDAALSAGWALTTPEARAIGQGATEAPTVIDPVEAPAPSKKAKGVAAAW